MFAASISEKISESTENKTFLRVSVDTHPLFVAKYDQCMFSKIPRNWVGGTFHPVRLHADFQSNTALLPTAFARVGLGSLSQKWR